MRQKISQTKAIELGHNAIDHLLFLYFLTVDLSDNLECIFRIKKNVCYIEHLQKYSKVFNFLHLNKRYSSVFSSVLPSLT